MLFALLLNLCMLVNTLDMIHLNTSNLITVKGPITDDLATQFVYEINQKQEKNDLCLILSSRSLLECLFVPRQGPTYPMYRFPYIGFTDLCPTER